MTGPGDLTRWNRAGLERFRYVDATAVTLLEDVRVALEKAFPDWRGVQADIPEPESDAERLDRLLAAYAAPRRDWAYEIARSFVRASHILTEHVDAFANEGFLSTATQWEYMRRLTAMLDYRPIPPASAATTVGLLAKEDAAPGVVAAGLAMKHSPKDGGPPLVFETLADLAVDPALNGLRLAEWQVNPGAFTPSDTPSDPGWVLPEKHAISAGQPAIVDDLGAREVLTVTAVDGAGLTLGPPSGTTANMGTTVLLAEPDRVFAPRLNGPDVLTLARTEGLAPGQVIGWKDGGATGFARIAAMDASGVRLDQLRPAGRDTLAPGATLHATRMIGNAAFAAVSAWRLPKDTQPSIVLVPATAGGSLGAMVAEPVLDGPGAATSESGAFKVLTDPPAAHDLHWFDPAGDPVLATVAAAPAGAVLDFDGGPGPLRSGDLLVAEDGSGARAAVEIASIAERDGGFTLTFAEALPASLRGVARLHGPFKQSLRPVGHDVNDTPVATLELTLDAAPADLPDLLGTGRLVLVETDPVSAAALPFTARIAKVAGTETITVTLDATVGQLNGFTTGNLVLRANAVLAGHGETRPPLVLGNGDAARTGQSFTLEREEVSFVADPTLDAGVRAALEVSAGGLKFTEVSTLADSEADAAHYTVQMTEEGYLTLRFGDGFHGRRLPTGRNNIVAAFRQGTGRAGNMVAADSFAKPAAPHPLIRAIRQPLKATGGQDIEDSAGIRRNAPAHLRTLDRAVSLSDVEYLAERQPGVWHAKAFLSPRGAARRERIELAVVPVDGDLLGALKGQIRDRLIELAPPGIEFAVEDFDPVPLPLRVKIGFDSSTHDPETVESAVRKALEDAFALERRKPGEPIYLSEVYQAVEGAFGVVYSTAFIFEDLPDPLTGETGTPLRHVARGAGDAVWAAWPTGRQAIYLTSGAAAQIELSEVSL